MDLTPEQTEAVKEWVASGASLSEVQSRLKEEFGLSITYMDVRFLVDDLDLALKEAPKKKPAPSPSQMGAPGGDGKGKKVVEGNFDDVGPSPADLDDDDPSDFMGGNVSVTIDQVTRPGAVVSGTVTFSDGVKAQWSVDQMGRLGLSGTGPDYKPSDEDIMAFQRELQNEVQKRGGF